MLPACSSEPEEDFEMPAVDLSLAVNYVPAVGCLLKTLVMLTLLLLIGPGEHFGCYTLIALLLSVDRVLSRQRILDGNCLLCVMLGSSFVNFIRAGIPPPVPVFVNVFIVLWVAVSLLITVEPEQVREFEKRFPTLYMGLPVFFSTLGVGSSTVAHMNADSSGLVISRCMCFALFSILWVYVIGVWRSKPSDLKRNGVLYSHCLVLRFSPMLFVSGSAAVAFGFASAGCVVYQYYVIHHTTPCPSPSASGQGSSGSSSGSVTKNKDVERPKRLEAGLNQVTLSSQSSTLIVLPLDKNSFEDTCQSTGVSYGPNAIHTIQEEDNDEDLEACFRSACQNRLGYSPVATGVAQAK